MDEQRAWAMVAAELDEACAVACKSLGYVDPALAPVMAYVLWANWSGWPSGVGKHFREIGRELDHAEKVSLGFLPQTHCTEQAYAGLTEAGRAVGPNQAYAQTFRKAAKAWSGAWRMVPPPPSKPRQPSPDDLVDIVKSADLIRAKLTPEVGEPIWFEVDPTTSVRRLGPNRVRVRRWERAAVVYTLERGKLVRRRPLPEER